MSEKIKEKYVRPKTQRVSGSVPLPINEQLDYWASLAGMQKGAFISIVIQLGLQAWIRAYAPEKTLSPEDWAKITKGMNHEENNNEKAD